MQIKVTVYLELSSASNALFTAGENDLIKQILGDTVSTDNTLYALRGENLYE